MVLRKLTRFPTQLHYLFQLVLFWLVLFTLFRIFFLSFHYVSGATPHFYDSVHSLVAGFRLDLSTIAYLTLPAFMLWAFHQVFQHKIIRIINFIYHLILLFLVAILNVGNFKMYPVWESLLSYKVMDYIRYPSEVVAFIPFGELLAWIVFSVFYFLFSLFLYRSMVTNFSVQKGSAVRKVAITLLTPCLLVLVARGGWQLVPINESSAYFSATLFYNHVSVNPVWYFIHSYLESDSSKNPYHFMDDSGAAKRTENLLSTVDSNADTILTTIRPNIVMIILESYTADIIQSLGGETGVTPFFDSLRKDGLLFTQIYSIGWRTEHGLVSILSGYPMPPHQSIITVPSKSEKLPSISNVLDNDGYQSSFYYGGDIEFVNMKSYLIHSHFENIYDKSNFNQSQLNSKWGAHDEYVLDKQLQDLKSAREPFFSVVLTLSSHEPFEVPMDTPFHGTDDSDKFRKAAYYTDHCLSAYFKKAKQERWYANTLFILVADHGSRLPKLPDLNMPESKKIPLLFVGDVLKEKIKGTTVDKIGNQNDIAATLLSQLHRDHTFFSRSKDILNPSTKEFAYYTNDNVLGWITPSQSFIYFYTSQKLQLTSDPNANAVVNDSLFMDAKAYLQTHYSQYLAY